MASQSRIVDSGSNYQFYDKNINPNIKRSSFDVSYLNLFLADCGYAYPSRFDFYQLNETHKLSQKALVRMPNNPVVPLMSRVRLFTNTYGVNFTSLWDKFSVFMTKGYTGNIVGVIPKLSVGSLFANSGTLDANTLRLAKVLFGSLYDGSLLDFFGIRLPYSLSNEDSLKEGDPVTDVITNLGISSAAFMEITIPLLPLMAYWRIMRDYYLNRNLVPSDIVRTIFTDSDSDFRLTGPVECVYRFAPYSGSDYRLCWVDGDNLSYVKWSLSNLLNCFFPSIDALGYMFSPMPTNWADDYFTSATLTPQRGDAPTLNATLPENIAMHLLNEDDEDLGTAYVNLLTTDDYGQAYPGGKYSNILLASGSNYDGVLNSGTSSNVKVFGGITNFTSGYGDTVQSNSFLNNPSRLILPSSVNFGISMSDLRGLVTAQLIQEKSMRTDGSYREFGKTFFDRTPKNADDYRPDYIGGTYQPIVFTETLQTSASVEGSQLGRQTGHGISSDSGFIGVYDTNDFGYIISLSRFVPDTYYSQGQIRWLSYEVQEDFPLPERMELGQQAILNKELYFLNKDGFADDVFGYQNRFDELRYRANEVHGSLRNPNELYWSNFTQARFFDARPSLTLSFTRMDNVSKDWLTSTSEPAFVCQFLNEDIAVKPMPYKSIPGGLI